MDQRYRAFLFDLNGTMIDDMDYHIRAWHRILNELGAGISLDRMREECYGKNHELLERIFPGRFNNEEKHRLSIDKETTYQQEFRPNLRLIDGLNEVLAAAKAAGIRMAIGSAAIMYNIDFVLDNLGIRHYFDAIVSADDVRHSKPNPETYLDCAAKLGIATEHCLVFEDAPKGVESAANANMKAVVLTIMHPKEDFQQYSNITSFINDYTEFPVDQYIKKPL